jgi:2-oxoglutarate ferredoxin oxidoreductase subunit beta
VEVVETAAVPESELLVHDPAHPEPSQAFALSRLTQGTCGATPIGIFRAVDRPVYDELMAEQLETARGQKGEGDLEKLLRAGDVWEIS